jgi:hypothetical protein
LATGAEAIERISGAADLLPANVFRTARILREAGKGLWPEAAKGGGRGAAHVRPRHLVNLAIAIAVNDPAAAVKVIPAYRALIPHRRDQHTLDEKDIGLVANLLKIHGMFNGQRDFSAELEQLIELLTQGQIANELEHAGAYTEFFFDRLPRANFVYRTFDAEDDTDVPTIKLLYRRPNLPPDLPRELDPYWNFPYPRLITRTAIIPVSVFSAMAELWADTKQHLAIATGRRATRPAMSIEE